MRRIRAGLWRFPVLGMKGEQLRSSQVDTRGDRRRPPALHERAGGTADARGSASRWRAGRAAFPFNPDGADHARPPAAVSPADRARTGRRRSAGATRGSLSALERDLGRPVELLRDLDAHARGDHRRDTARGRARGGRDQRPAQARSARRRVVRSRTLVPRRSAAPAGGLPRRWSRNRSESGRGWPSTARRAGHAQLGFAGSSESSRRTGPPCCASMRLLGRSWRRRLRGSSRRARLTAKSCSGW